MQIVLPPCIKEALPGFEDISDRNAIRNVNRRRSSRFQLAAYKNGSVTALNGRLTTPSSTCVGESESPRLAEEERFSRLGTSLIQGTLQAWFTLPAIVSGPQFRS
jgi:hypothetical protein